MATRSIHELSSPSTDTTNSYSRVVLKAHHPLLASRDTVNARLLCPDSFWMCIPSLFLSLSRSLSLSIFCLCPPLKVCLWKNAQTSFGGERLSSHSSPRSLKQSDFIFMRRDAKHTEGVNHKLLSNCSCGSSHNHVTPPLSLFFSLIFFLEVILRF